MKRFITVLAAAALALMLLPGPASSQSAGSAFYERIVLTDEPDDYAANGGLDIVAVHASEAYSFDFERRTEKDGNTVNFRIEVAALDALVSQTTPRFHLFLDANGSAQNLWVDLVYEGGSGGCQCWTVGSTSAGVTGGMNSTSVSVRIPYSLFGSSVGAELGGVWAATSLGGGEDRVFQDVAPMDNGGLPAGGPETPSPGSTANVTLEGPFPYVQLVPKGSLERFSAEGAAVTYPFQVEPHPQLNGEMVMMFFEIPAGWTVEPSRGSSGANPTGQVTNLNGGTQLGFDVTVSAASFPELGTEAVVNMTLVSTSGAHQTVEMVTSVSGPKLNSSEYQFDLMSPARAEAESTTKLEFRVLLANGSALPAGAAVKVDMMRQGEVVETVPTTADGNGTYIASYAFPSEGEWTADAYISNLRPSPHQEFTIQVESGGVLPGPGLFALLAGVLGAAFLAYRRRT